ncbi:MAG: hypothetical protein ACP5N3_05645 [Candidatus Nanoarchaeia archaeon]
MNKKINLNNKGKISKTTIILGICALVFIAVFGIISVYALNGTENSGTKTGSTNTPLLTGNNNQEYQTATLKYVNYEYILEPNTLKKDVPVRITVDTNTVVGCMRDIIISEFGIRKKVSPGNNIIEFTPNKEGTFWIVCSMNMGRGTFSVSSDGTASSVQAKAPVAPPSPSGGSTCGMASGGGGCGCGMR